MSEFSDLFGDWASHGVDVKKRLGVNGQGDVYPADWTPVADVMVEEERKIVINGDGSQQTSNATIYCEPEDLAFFGEKAQVRLPSGRVAVVISIRKLDVFGLIGHGVVSTT